MLPRAVSRSRRALLIRLVGTGVGQALAAIGLALLVQQGFDRLVDPARPVSGAAVAVLTVCLIGAVGAAAAFRGLERVAAERLGQHYVLEVRERLFAHLLTVPARELGRRSRGSMLLRFVGDLSALRLWVSLGLARLIVAGVAIGLALVALAVMDVALGLVVGVVLLGGGVATWRTSPRLLRTAREARRRRARLTGEVSERLTNVGVVQSSGQERRESRRVRERSDRVATAMVARARAAGTARAVAEATAGLAGVGALLLGAAEVRAGRATVGTVLAAVSVVGLLSGHLRDLGRVAEYAAAARVARDAVRRFLLIPPLADPPGLPDLDEHGGVLEFCGVSLDDALVGVTVRAEAGQTIAIVGSNGAGKSTLVGLAARLVDPDSGVVRLDGQDLRSVSLSSVRRAVGVSGPDLPLLRGSVSRNVRYRRPRADDADVARVSALCGLDELVAQLPDGWSTDVGEGGGRLSAGQRARISLARAALGDPSLLVLDEAEAHLDPEATAVVDWVIADHRGTTLVVTHRLSIVERADVVWCLDGGRIVEVGPPSQLLHAGGSTAQLFSPAPGTAVAVGG